MDAWIVELGNAFEKKNGHGEHYNIDTSIKQKILYCIKKYYRKQLLCWHADKNTKNNNNNNN